MAVRTMTEDGINLYPLDVAALEKGDTIPAELCEQHTKCKDMKSPRYPLELLDLRERIDLELRKQGRNWTLVCKSLGIKVLTDEEASIENERSFKAHQRALGRRCAKNMSVDVSRLSPDRVRPHEHEVLAQQMILAAGKRARRQLSLATHKRTTPGLPTAAAEAKS
jgi:hypothetical protein